MPSLDGQRETLKLAQMPKTNVQPSTSCTRLLNALGAAILIIMRCLASLLQEPLSHGRTSTPPFRAGSKIKQAAHWRTATAVKADY